jgi:hypothetical protein
MPHRGETNKLDRQWADVNDETLSGDKTLTQYDPVMQRLDPDNAGGRTITLPAEEGAKGKAFRILNTADGAEDLTVEDDGSSTVVTISQNEAAWVACDGSGWFHMGIETISLS